MKDIYVQRHVLKDAHRKMRRIKKSRSLACELCTHVKRSEVSKVHNLAIKARKEA